MKSGVNVNDYPEPKILSKRIVRPHAAPPVGVLQSYDRNREGRQAWLCGPNETAENGQNIPVASHFLVDSSEWKLLPFDIVEPEVRWYSTETLLVFARNYRCLDEERDAAVIDVRGNVLQRFSLGVSIGDVLVGSKVLFVGYDEVAPDPKAGNDRTWWAERAIALDETGSVKWGLHKSLLSEGLASRFELMSCAQISKVSADYAILVGYGIGCDRAAFWLNLNSLAISPLMLPQLSAGRWARCLTQRSSHSFAFVEQTSPSEWTVFECEGRSARRKLDTLPRPTRARVIESGDIMFIYGKDVLVLERK